MKVKYFVLSALTLTLMGCGGDSDSSNQVDPVPDPDPEPTEPSGENKDLMSAILPSAILTVPEVNCTEVFSSTSALENAVSQTMQAGTTLCLADGEYQDLEITYGGAGTESAPIKVAAENSGKAIIKGSAKIAMGGSYVHLQGLVFDGGESSSSNLIATRFGTANLCHDCRITEIAVLNVDSDKGISNGDSSSGEWLNIYGKNIWLDHSIFSGKTTASPMISFNRWVDSSWSEEQKLAELAQGVIVYNNYIANRAPSEGQMYATSSDNNYEAIRTGLSDTHQYDGDSMIVGNLFENIQGEAEVISNKGSNNTISFNTVRNSYGSITTRHGSGADISNNFILGDDYPFAGGLRIVDGDHNVTNNYIEGARYKATTHHGGIVLIGHDGAGDGDNGYQQVENVHIANNTIVDSVNSFNVDGGGKSSQPKTVYFANNVVDQAIGAVITQAERGLPPESYFTGNIIHGQQFSDDAAIPEGTSGFEFASAALVKDSTGLYRASDNSPNLDAIADYERGEFSAPEIDMDGTVRSETTMVGADETFSVDSLYTPLTYDDVGPLSYSLDKPQAIMQQEAIVNPAFDNGLDGWGGSATVATGEDAFSRDSSVMVSAGDSINQSVALTPNTRYALSAFVKGTYSIAIDDQVVLDGQASTSDYAWVSQVFTTDSRTTGTLTVSLPDEVELYANVQDPQFGLWRKNSGSSDVWNTFEGSDDGLGDVGSSGDSAFNDELGSNGSARVRFKNDVASHDFSVKPGVSQVVTGLPLNSDMTFSIYYCDNKGSSSLSTLYYGVRAATDTPLDGQILAENRAHVSELGEAPQGSVKSCFKQVTVDFNSGSHDSVELFALMEIDSSLTDAEIYTHNQYIDDDLEVRIDEASLVYRGAPNDGVAGYLDDIRLIKRIDQ